MTQPAPSAPPPQAVLMQLLNGKHIAYCLTALARLGVADHMTAEVRPVEDIATSAGVHAPSLYRVLRMLASVGVFAQDGRSFGLTPVSDLLRTGAPGSLRYLAWTSGDGWATSAVANLDHCLLTGEDGVTKAYGKGTFEMMADHPDQLEVFQRAMSNLSAGAAIAILDAYDFSGIERLADVGGGHGTLLAGVLNRYANLQGVLADLPEVSGGALSGGHFAGCEDRVTIEPGSFFERVPAGCDAYMLKHILHDWSDAACATILSLIRDRIAANPRSGRVLVCEMVVPDGPEPSPAKMLDIEMLAATVGGRERTAGEFAELYASAGLRLERIVPTKSPIAVIEGRLA